MTQNSMISRNLKILSNQPPISHKFSINLTSPRSNQNNQSDHQDQILVKVSLIIQLFQQYKSHEVQLQEFLKIFRQASFILKKSQSKYRKLELPKQIANLNRIKEQNQRILQGIIKSLEEQLKKLAYQETSLHQKFYQMTELKVKNSQKDLQITKLKKRLQQKQKYLVQIQNINIKLSIENIKLQQIIKRQQSLTFVQLNQNDIQTRKTFQVCRQTQNLENREKKIEMMNSQIIFARKGVKNNQIFVQNRQNLLCDNFQSLQATNSFLRKLLLYLQKYIQQQDEKYQQNIQYLQQKIKKLTLFKINRSTSNSLTASTLNHSNHIIFNQKPNKRSDINNSVHLYSKQKYQHFQILKLADLKIKFQLNNSKQADIRLINKDKKICLNSSLN